MKYVAAVLVVLALWSGWRLLANRTARIPPDFLDTYTSLGEGLVEQSGVAEGDVVIVVSASETNQPIYHKLAKGITRAAKRFSTGGAVSESVQVIDPMAEQNGTGALRWSAVQAIWTAHPNARLMVLMVDVWPPAATERPTAGQVVVFRPPLGEDSRNLLKTGAIRLLVTPRSPASPAPPKDAPLWKRSFDLIPAAS